eukprot:symbB.v1.2.041452.t1/scaffold8219.1/size7238/1
MVDLFAFMQRTKGQELRQFFVCSLCDLMPVGITGEPWTECPYVPFARHQPWLSEGHRGLASCPPLTRICAELRPVQGFVEQRAKTPGQVNLNNFPADSQTQWSDQEDSEEGAVASDYEDEEEEAAASESECSVPFDRREMDNKQTRDKFWKSKKQEWEL